MVLAIDMGNTNIVIGCIEDGKVLFVERMETNRSKTELEYSIGIKAVLELYGIETDDIEGAILSSVVPHLTYVLKEAVRKAISQTPLVVGPGMKNGICLKMDNPNTVGSDLVVDAEENYIGGMILPGIRCALESLITRTSQLPHIELERPKRLIGKNTIECMKSGMLYGNASCIDGMINRIIDELGYDAPVVATGGLANLVIPMCRHEIIVDEELLLKGLDLIFQKNRSRYYVRK